MNQTQQHGSGDGSEKRRGTTTRPKPETVFRCLIPTGKGESVLGSVSERQGESNGEKSKSMSISLQSSYYSETVKKWIYDSRFKPNQIAALNYVLQQCTNFLFAAKDVNNREGGGEELGNAYEGS